MSDLGISNVPSGIQDFATIPDVSVDTLTNRVAPRQVASGVSRGAQVIIGSTGVPQVLSGSQDTFGEGFYVTKPGIDVTTNKDTSQFIFNSNQNVFKIVSSGTLSSGALTIADPGLGNFATNGVSIQVAHGLSYKPAIIGYALDTGVYYNMPRNNVTGGGSAVAWINFDCAVDSQYVYANLYATVGHTALNLAAGAYVLKYYLLQETAN